jgi:hypothetical protein
MPLGAIELIRLAPGLTTPQVDGVVARMAVALGGETSQSGYGRTAVHTVLGVSMGFAVLSAVLFHRGDDVVIVYAGDADTAWDVAAAYLDATAPPA